MAKARKSRGKTRTPAQSKAAPPAPPCPRCLALAWNYQIRRETVMPLPAFSPPLAEDGSGPCCYDCQAADTLGRLMFRSSGERTLWVATKPGGDKQPVRSVMPFSAWRVAVANERQDQLRLPEAIRRMFGLVGQGLVQPSVGENPLDDHHAWLASVGLVLDGTSDEHE